MKKLFTLDDLMIAFVSAIAYGFTWAISKNLGMSDVVAMVICIVVGGSALGSLGEGGLQRSRPEKSPLPGCDLCLLHPRLYRGPLRLGDDDGRFHDRWPGHAGVVGHLFPIVVFLISTLIRLYRVVLIRKQYGDGSKGYTFD